MGAYELTCDINVSNPFDWNADGIVNLHEFNVFSRAWLSHDPDDPAWLAEPNLAEAWNPMCNLADTGDSQYTIDLADILVFLEQAPWLWTACWKTDIWQTEMLMSGFGEESLKNAWFESESIEKQPLIPGITIQEKIIDLASLIVQLENLWLTEPEIQQTIEPDDWSRFMDAVYQNLYDLATESIQIE